MKKIAHVTDLHIDLTNRFEETERILDWIAGDIEKREVDLVVNAGDTFHRLGREPAHEEILVAGKFHRRLARTAEVVVVMGNHDHPGCWDSIAHHDDGDEESVYGSLAGAFPIKAYSRPAVHQAACGIQVACLPWPRYHGTVGASQQEAHQALVDVLRGLGSLMDERPDPRLFLGHVNIRGAKISEMSQPLCLPNGIDVGVEDLALVRAHAYLFGHIHLAQQIDIGGRPGIYPGSPKRVNWGESETKYYAVITIEDDGTVVDVEMVETPCRPMLKVEAEYRPGDGLVLEAPGYLHDAEIRLRVQARAEYLAAARAAANEAKRGWLSRGAFRVDVEHETIATIHARTPELTDGSKTLAEKLVILRTIRGEQLSSEHTARLNAKLAELETEVAS